MQERERGWTDSLGDRGETKGGKRMRSRLARVEKRDGEGNYDSDTLGAPFHRGGAGGIIDKR